MLRSGSAVPDELCPSVRTEQLRVTGQIQASQQSVRKVKRLGIRQHAGYERVGSNVRVQAHAGSGKAEQGTEGESSIQEQE